MFCSIKSFTGAILLGTSGEGVLARLRLDTTKPMMEKYYIASDQKYLQLYDKGLWQERDIAAS